MDATLARVLSSICAPRLEPSEDQLRSRFRWKYRNVTGPVFEKASKDEIDEIVLEYHAENAEKYSRMLLNCEPK